MLIPSAQTTVLLSPLSVKLLLIQGESCKGCCCCLAGFLFISPSLMSSSFMYVTAYVRTLFLLNVDWVFSYLCIPQYVYPSASYNINHTGKLSSTVCCSWNCCLRSYNVYFICLPSNLLVLSQAGPWANGEKGGQWLCVLKTSHQRAREMAQSTWARFSAPTWWFTTIHNASSRGSDALSSDLQGHQVHNWCSSKAKYSHIK